MVLVELVLHLVVGPEGEGRCRGCRRGGRCFQTNLGFLEEYMNLYQYH